VFADQRVVVVQPSEGTFTAFSAVCTHQGCAVHEVADGTINCACHGSKFDVADGSVVRGPARKALPQYRATVVGDVVRLDR
jgi:Rieske Fe-S protein